MNRSILTALIFFASPAIVFAATEKVIFNSDILQTDTATFWQIFNTQSEEVTVVDDGVRFISDGDAFLVYSEPFSYHDYDRLLITLKSDQALDITVIPNVSTTGINTFELKQNLPASGALATLEFSLRLPLFEKPITDLGIHLESAAPATISVSQISLDNNGGVGLLTQAVRDYLRVAPYSPFTVNLIPTPRVFGHSATVYLLPIIAIALVLLLRSKKWRTPAVLLLLGLWVMTDLRMTYEFLTHRATDYQTYVTPAPADKHLRGYGNFYQFAEWVHQTLPERQTFNLLSDGSGHFPRIMQYLVYPQLVDAGARDNKTYVVYQRDDVRYNQDQQRLFINNEPLSALGTTTAVYGDDAFIFQEQ